MMPGDVEVQMESVGSKDPVTSKDWETRVKSRRRVAEVELGSRRTEMTPV